MPDVVAIALRFLHIMFAIAWVGAVIFGVVVLRVVMPKVEPPSRKAVLLRLLPVNLRYVPLTATFTITFGVLLYAYLDYFNPVNIDALLRVKLLLVALFLAVGTLSFGMAVPLRAGRKILGHLQEAQCTHMPVMGALQKQFNLGQIIAMALLLVVLGLMVAAPRV